MTNLTTLDTKTRSILVLQPRGGDYAAFTDFFRQNDVLGKAVRLAGAWSAEVHVPVSGQGPVVVTALWDSPEAYDGWRTHPIRAEMGPAMERLVEDGPSPAISSGVYQVAVSASRT